MTDGVPDRSGSVIANATTRGTGDDTAAWPRLEAHHRTSRDDVFAYLRSLLGDRSTAEDVTELAFERVPAPAVV